MKRKVAGGGPGNQNHPHVRGKRLPVGAVHLSHQALDPVSDHGLADAARYRKSNFPSLAFLPGHVEHKRSSHELAAPLVEGVEISPANEMLIARERIWTRQTDSLPPSAQAQRRLRPRARRRDSTLRPPGVAMRARNPCVRFRLITEG